MQGSGQVPAGCRAVNVMEYSAAVGVLANKLKSIDGFKDELDVLVNSISIEENIYEVMTSAEADQFIEQLKNALILSAIIKAFGLSNKGMFYLLKYVPMMVSKEVQADKEQSVNVDEIANILLDVLASNKIELAAADAILETLKYKITSVL